MGSRANPKPRLQKTRTIPVVSESGDAFTVVEYTEMRARPPGWVPGERLYTLAEGGERVTLLDPDGDVFESISSGERLYPRYSSS